MSRRKKKVYSVEIMWTWHPGYMYNVRDCNTEEEALRQSVILRRDGKRVVMTRVIHNGVIISSSQRDA